MPSLRSTRRKTWTEYLKAVAVRQVGGLSVGLPSAGGHVLDGMVLGRQCEAPGVEDRPMIVVTTAAAFLALGCIQG